MFEIFLVDKPLLILELRVPSYLDLPSTRQVVDEEIRSRMNGMVSACPLETLHAISALGTKLCFYSLNTRNRSAQIVPAAIPRHPTEMNDTAPADRWNYDILEPAGEERLRLIVKQIMDGCAALNV